MSLNAFFLGSNAHLNVTTHLTVDEIRLRVASHYSMLRPNTFGWFTQITDHEKYLTEYVASFHNKNITFYFADHLNRKMVHPFSLLYPNFEGQIIDHGDLRQVSGRIGIHPWIFIQTLIVFCVLSFFTVNWIKGNDQFLVVGKIATGFLIFSLGSFMITLIRTRKKVDQMNEMLTHFFATK